MSLQYLVKREWPKNQRNSPCSEKTIKPMHKYVNIIFFTGVKLFTIARPSNSQNDRVYDGINKVKKDVDCRRLLLTRPTFSHSVMASVGISALGRTSIQFVEPGVKVNGELVSFGDYYCNVLLRQGLLSEMRKQKMHRLGFFWNTVNFFGFSVIHVSQGSVATRIRCGGMST